MEQKLISEIKRITLNSATYKEVEIEPTQINIFYGNNGTGKSTIARTIKSNNEIEWKTGKSNIDYSIMTYDQEFIKANFQNYGNLRGVFTVGEANITVQNLIEEKSKQKDIVDKNLSEAINASELKQSERNTLINNFQDKCWNRTKDIRNTFIETQGGFKRKIQFAEHVLTVEPIEHSFTELKNFYEIAYDKNARLYPLFKQAGDVKKLAAASYGLGVLKKPVISSSDTPFMDFINSINATNWVRQGHEQFVETPGGKCPYCQQQLPEDFKNQIAVCFDERFQGDIDAIKQFKTAYESDIGSFIELFKANLFDAYPKLDLSGYNDKVSLFEKLLEINIVKIDEKLREPATIVTLENVRRIREEINSIISGFNKLIQENNNIVNAKQQKQNECKKQVWELIAYTLQDEVMAYQKNITELNTAINNFDYQIAVSKKTSQVLYNEISELSKQVTSTKPTVDGINSILIDSGFQGFSLREKGERGSVYEVIRQDGSIAEDLSEGERNFIAFLYFYHLIKGSHNDNDINKDKIVIIDDPVGMDSGVLLIISTLIREMIETCIDNYDYLKKWDKGNYIKQMFILTHNEYFYKEITNQLERYECVSFYTINKTNNMSSVMPYRLSKQYLT